eukprot:6193144-Pleurochrysis_carterae.AAC.3
MMNIRASSADKPQYLSAKAVGARAGYGANCIEPLIETITIASPSTADQMQPSSSLRTPSCPT